MLSLCGGLRLMGVQRFHLVLFGPAGTFWLVAALPVM
jgi:hypothetical protein